MLGRLRGTILVAGALALGGCGDTGTPVDDIGTLWGQEPKSVQEARARTAIKVPIQSVKTIELGRTRDGFIITAFGTAPGLGYSVPSLQVRREGVPGSDGFIEYDFVARAPAEGFSLPPGTVKSRSLRADQPITVRDLGGAVGIRVHALSGGVQVQF